VLHAPAAAIRPTPTDPEWGQLLGYRARRRGSDGKAAAKTRSIITKTVCVCVCVCVCVRARAQLAPPTSEDFFPRRIVSLAAWRLPDLGRYADNRGDRAQFIALPRVIGRLEANYTDGTR